MSAQKHLPARRTGGYRVFAGPCAAFRTRDAGPSAGLGQVRQKGSILCWTLPG